MQLNFTGDGSSSFRVPLPLFTVNSVTVAGASVAFTVNGNTVTTASALTLGAAVSVDLTNTAPTIATNEDIIASAAINGSGHLIVTLKDGSSFDAGAAVGPQGTQGVQGVTGATGAAGAAGATGATGESWATNDPAIFQATGAAQNWVVPAGVTRIRVRMWGGGGPGTTATASVLGAGGSSGQYVEFRATVAPGSTVVVNPGGGGVPGSNGTTTTVTLPTAEVLEAFGGSAHGGAANFVNATTANVTSIFSIQGAWGENPLSANVSGAGATAPQGGSGGRGVGSVAAATDTNGQLGLIPGGGGSGSTYSSTGAAVGGNGAPGLVIIEY